jgi:Protein of unknown function (DUF4013)
LGGIVMDIGDVISDSLRYPSSDWIKVLILGVLFIISFLIIPLFLAIGYMFRVIKASLAGVEELPSFDEWGEMFVDGIRMFLVYLIYSLPAIIIGVLSIISLLSSIRSLTYITQISGNTITPEMVVSLFGGTALAGLVVAGIYALIIYPIIAVAIGNMAYYNGEFRAAFRFGELFSTISSIGWVDLIIWYIVMIIIGIAIGFIASILGIIPILGWIILIFIVYPYYYLFYARAIAWLYASAFGEEYTA